MSGYQDLRAQAIEALQQGDPQTAFYRLRGALSWPGPEQDEDLYDALRLMGEVVVHMAGPGATAAAGGSAAVSFSAGICRE